MAPIQMRNLTTFPIEHLCFNLKLEVFEQLDADDVVELVKVNQGFQWMISSRPSIVFRHHVHAIEFGFDPQGIEAINIKKLNGKVSHFPFIKNIRSCNQLNMFRIYDTPIDRDHVAFLKQLEAVNSLHLDWFAAQNLEFLSHLSIKIKRYAGLPSFIQKTRSIKDLVGRFIEAQLSECKIVRFNCHDDDGFQFYYNALIKTHIKYVVIRCYNENHIVPAIQRIVSLGIPSKNPAAVVRVFDDCVDYRKATIVIFLKGYPGMKRINEKNRQPFITLANEFWKISGYRALTMKTLCFRRNINPTRDCIYMWYSGQFLAFYIKPDEMVDH